MAAAAAVVDIDIEEQGLKQAVELAAAVAVELVNNRQIRPSKLLELDSQWKT